MLGSFLLQFSSAVSMQPNIWFSEQVISIVLVQTDPKMYSTVLFIFIAQRFILLQYCTWAHLAQRLITNTRTSAVTRQNLMFVRLHVQSDTGSDAAADNRTNLIVDPELILFLSAPTLISSTAWNLPSGVSLSWPRYKHWPDLSALVLARCSLYRRMPPWSGRRGVSPLSLVPPQALMPTFTRGQSFFCLTNKLGLAGQHKQALSGLMLGNELGDGWRLARRAAI